MTAVAEDMIPTVGGPLNDIAAACHENARNKGFYEPLSAEHGERAHLLMVQIASVIAMLEYFRKGEMQPLIVYDAINPPWSGDDHDEQFMAALKLALLVSEAIETYEVLGTNHEAEEVADIVIRLFDYAAWRGLDLDEAVSSKMTKNAGRTHKHGGQF